MATTDLTGKVAVVTGGGSGIGKATVERLAALGAAVVVADLNATAADEVAQKATAGGARATGVQVDVTDTAAIERVMTFAESEFGSIDLLSCNAGFARFPTSALETTEEDFDKIFEVNVKGVWLSVKAAIPAMRRAGGGSITITGSVMGERTRSGFSAYASSKAASNHLARTLALELAPERIRVNAVAPVATDTAMLPQFLGPGDQQASREKFIAGIPMGRLAEPEDIADAAVFLLSDSARFITGVVLPVDGGRSI